MTEQETKSILAYLSATWDMAKDKDPQQVLAVWADVFRDDDVVLVRAATRLYVNQERFAPKPADIRAKMQALLSDRDKTEMEAWNMVRRAIRGASMESWSRTLTENGPGEPSAVVAFKKLPPEIQLVVGSPEQLANWEALDGKQLDTVIQSNFMRSYRSVIAEKEQLGLLPENMRQALLQKRSEVALLEDGNRG
jgi:hypothetical protein